MAAPSFQTKTLFYDAATRAAVLVTNRDGRRRRAMRLADPHTALDWAISHSCYFVFVIAPNPAKN